MAETIPSTAERQDAFAVEFRIAAQALQKLAEHAMYEPESFRKIATTLGLYHDYGFQGDEAAIYDRLTHAAKTVDRQATLHRGNAINAASLEARYPTE